MQKFLSATGLFALILWGCTAVTPLIHAQNTGQDPPQQETPAGQTLTNDSLKTILDNMGYEPKKLTNGYLLAIKQDTWTLNMQLVISPDTRKLGLNSNLGLVEDPSAIKASEWMNLLISNGEIDPSAFYFSKDQKKLYLHRSFDNRAVTPAVMRREIDNFANTITKTADLWKFTK